MQYRVQLFSWTPRQGVQQVGRVIDTNAPSAKLAVLALLNLPLDEAGAPKNLAARVWQPDGDEKADCACFYYH
ncbi:hypothetical protein BJF93_17330 [Xaviernesmea oryzae]|uniref:Uncharacterized protein n=1 Tax=Xaviernesmea oryzae TaxID=464029 RepID=A0A1Q9ATA1_9HYPH|nr:hypothetical protein [Xaviernesmea oryzae]OLP58608.1 hypothetical protein BJF93_17330 [Xaviernesmea oryzae]SEK63943.1 hypothetical protein SAMN04487976_103171 [Xaviernesmea oryzae]